MKRFLFVPAVVAACATSSFAQNSILAGKIVDENNKPVPNAMVRIRNKAENVFTTAKSDTDGVYCSKLLPAGTYHVMLVAKGRQHNLHKMELPDMTREKKYYNVVVKDKDVEMTELAESTYLRDRIAEISARQKNVEGPGPRKPSSLVPANFKVQHGNAVPPGEAVPQGK